jgi:hypothetical protein
MAALSVDMQSCDAQKSPGDGLPFILGQSFQTVENLCRNEENSIVNRRLQAGEFDFVSKIAG